MPDAQNDHFVFCAQIIDDHVRLVAMDADRWRDLFAQAGGVGVFGQEREYGLQSLMLGVGLGESEILDPFAKQGGQIVNGGAGQAIAGCHQASAVCSATARARMSAMVSSLRPPARASSI